MLFVYGFITGVFVFLVAIKLLPTPQFIIKHIPLVDEEGRFTSKIEVSPSETFFLPKQEYKVYSYLEGEEVNS